MQAVSAQTAKGRATRERILEAAGEVAVLEDGHVEIASVASTAGVAPSLIYRYFGSRAGLLSALVERFYERLHEQVLDENLAADGPWVEQERGRLERGVRFYFEEPLFTIVHTRLSREPEVAQAESRQIDLVIGDGADNIRRAQGRGELRRDFDPDLAAAAIFGSLQRVLVAAVSRTGRPSEEAVVEVLWRQVLAAVRLDPDQSESGYTG